MNIPDVFSLYEAYVSVYVNQEEIKEWALDLIEEGYDLNDYSDNELIEAFITERKNNDPKGVAHKAGINEPDAWGPPTKFGQEATRNSLAAGIRGVRKLQQQGVRVNRHHRNKYLSHQVHKGWSHAAQNSEHQTPEQKERRSKLISPDLNTFRTKLSKTERAKDLPFVKKAETAAKTKGQRVQEELDLYDIVLDHLLDEGYCDDVESAEIIMVNMSEEWVDCILEKADNTIRLVYGKGGKGVPFGNDGNVLRTPNVGFDKQGDSFRQATRDAARRFARKASKKIDSQDGVDARLSATQRKNITRLNAKPNVGTPEKDEKWHVQPEDKTSYYPEVPTDYRARRRRASGR